MARKPLRILLLAIVVGATSGPTVAEEHEATIAEQRFAELERSYTPTSRVVQQVAFVAPVPTPNPSAPSLEPMPTPGVAPPTVIPPSGGPALYPATAGTNDLAAAPSSPSDAWCLVSPGPCRTSSWTAAIELIPSETLINDATFGRWDDNDAFALRLVLGYEDPDGIGIRARFWGLGEDASTPADDVELTIGAFDLDLYKRLFFDHADIAIGGGPSSGGLEFKLSDDTHSRFGGGGATVFVDGYYTLQEFQKSELGAVLRARYSVLMGNWRDTTGGAVVPDIDNDVMSVTELAWGLEYRRRFGTCEDHSWFLGLLLEYQRWQSDWMSNLTGTSLGVSGLNVYTGLNW